MLCLLSYQKITDCYKFSKSEDDLSAQSGTFTGQSQTLRILNYSFVLNEKPWELSTEKGKHIFESDKPWAQHWREGWEGNSPWLPANHLFARGLQRNILSACNLFGIWYFLNQLSSPRFLLRCRCCKSHSCHNPLGCRRFPRHFSVYQLIASTFHFQYWAELAKDGVPLQCSHSQRMGRLQLAEVRTAC